MSALHEWDFTVPDDDNELLAELCRHGVRPGSRLRVSIVSDEASSTRSAGPPLRRLSFVGTIHAEPDLSERVDEYLRGQSS